MNNRRLVILIIFLAIFAMAARVSVDSDTWWHLAAGRLILEEGRIPLTDIFSSSRYGEPWLGASVGWIMQTTLYLIYNSFGPGGLNVFTALMITITFILIYQTLSGGVFLRAFVLILAATTSGVYWAARPYLISFVFSGLFLWILEDYRWRRKDRLWLLPIIMVIWANSHAGFAYGQIFWGLYGIAEGVEWILAARKADAVIPTNFSKAWLLEGIKGRVGKMLLIGLLLVIAICLNPSGPVMLLYPFETIAITALQDHIQEWQSPNFHALVIQPFAWMIFLLIAVIGASERKLALSDFLLITVFIYMGLLAGRHIASFALVAPIVITRHAASITEKFGKKFNFSGLKDKKVSRFQGGLNWFLFTLLLFAVIVKTASVYPASMNDEHIHKGAPTGAIAYLKTHDLKGNMLNSYNWGGYLIWHLPEYPVFVDGRTDLYKDEVLSDWFKILRAEDNWVETMEYWDLNLVLLEPNLPVIRELELIGWQKLYEDEISVIMIP